MIVRTRNAPSPTGTPHIGNTRTALFDYLWAKKYKGKFILRIEDTDQSRLVPGSVEKIYAIHQSLGLIPDESPIVGGNYGPYIQTERLDLYQKYAHQLVESGHAYYCFCTEERLEKLHQDNPFAKYDRHCRNLSSQEIQEKLDAKLPYVIRAKMPESGFTLWQDAVQGALSLPNDQVDDKVLLKSDGIPTYNFAVVVDDHLMEITHVLRGVEYISSTPIHLFLYQAFSWKPPIFAHLPLLLGPDKSKLSKRHGAKSALEYIEDGYLPEAINNFMFYLGFSYRDNSDLFSLPEMIDVFDEHKIQKQNAIFDIQRLNHFNSAWIRKMKDNDLLSRLEGFIPSDWVATDQKMLQIIPLIKDRLTTLKDIQSLADFFFINLPVSTEDLLTQFENDQQALRNWLLSSIDVISAPSYSNSEELHHAFQEAQSKTSFTPKQAFMSLRLAITGKTVTPPLFDVIIVLGKDETIARLNKILKQLS